MIGADFVVAVRPDVAGLFTGFSNSAAPGGHAAIDLDPHEFSLCHRASVTV